MLKYWVENQLDDFDEDLMIQLKEFIAGLAAKSESLKKISESLLNYLEEQVCQLWLQVDWWICLD